MIYLDHAATSFPKPASVPAAMLRWFDEVGVSAERGEGPATAAAAQLVRRTRERLARRVGTTVDRVAFVSGATEGLNLALRALLRQGDRVLTTPLEHSSVVRPLRALEAARGVVVDVVDAGPDGDRVTEALLAALADGPPPALVVFAHAGNVTGDVLDAAAVCARAREVGSRTLVDACQTAGYLPLDVGADVLVASAHKAMHGPPGLGFVACRDGVALAPQKHGGTGSSTALDTHPTAWPTAFEAGTPNTPAIFGLAAALDWLDEQGDAALLAQSLDRLREVEAALTALPAVRTFAARTTPRTPALSFVHDAYDPLEVGAILAGAGVHVRSGFHCAPWLHQRLGTAAGGTVRVSPGPSTTEADVAALRDALRSL